MEHHKLKMPPKDPWVGFITGHSLSLRNDRLGYMYDSFIKYGDFLEMYLGKQRTLLINDPIALKQVLFEKAKNYPKNTPGYQRVADVIGMGVFTDIGEEWRKGRRVIQPIFNPSKFDHYFDVVDYETNRILNLIEESLKTTKKIDFSFVATKYALHVIGKSLLNEDLQGSFQIISESLAKLISLTERKMVQIFPNSRILNFRIDTEFAKEMKILNNEIQKIIENEKNKPRCRKNNFIHILADCEERFSDEKILSQVKTMIFAGHETSANALSWSLYFLSKFPEWQDRIFNEIMNYKGEILNEGDVLNLKNIQNFINEVLRVRPPVWSFGRKAIEEDTIHNVKVYPGDLISISPYLIHHHPKYWENPEIFNPDRFTNTPEPLTFIPFGAGQRVCMGERLANLEMMVFVYKIVKKYEIKELGNLDIKINPQISLRLDKKLKLEVTRR